MERRCISAEELRKLAKRVNEIAARPVVEPKISSETLEKHDSCYIIRKRIRKLRQMLSDYNVVIIR